MDSLIRLANRTYGAAIRLRSWVTAGPARLPILLVLVAVILLGSVVAAISIQSRLHRPAPLSAAARTSPTSAVSPLIQPSTASPSPTVSPSASPSPTPSAAPVAPPVAAPQPPPPPPPAGTRGIFRFSSRDWAAMRSVGFNASTDGGVQDGGDQQAAVGMTGMVWVGAYDNSSCAQTMSDSQIAGLVQANVNAGHRGLRYQVGDEPTANGCNAAPVYAHITQVVHGADPGARTWVADDQFQVGNAVQSGVPMKGSVDILAFDIYPCQSGPCDLSAIDAAVAQIHAAHLTNWEFIIQDFSSGNWRWPTPAEIQAQYDHWKGQGAIGYWVFAWDYQGQSVTAQAGNIAALQQINSH